MPHKLTHCSICAYGPRNGESPYCTTCRRLVRQALATGKGHRRPIRSAEAQSAIRASLERAKQLYGGPRALACHYSGIVLTTKKGRAKQGDYASFDHVIPNDPSRAVLCARLVNDIKGAMTDVEFGEYIHNVLDLPAIRKVHGLTPEQTRTFMAALQTAMTGVEAEAVKARRVLKVLAALVHFAPKPRQKSAKSPVPQAPTHDAPGADARQDVATP